MEILKFNVKELTQQEMISINGGGKLGEALRAAWDAICDAAEWVVYKLELWYYQKRQEYLNKVENEVYEE